MTELSIEVPAGRPTYLVCNARAYKRIVREVYAKFGGACYQCKYQLDINGTGLYAAPIIIHLPGELHPRRLACPKCAPAAPVPPQLRKTLVKGGTLLPYIQRLFQQQAGRCAYCNCSAKIAKGNHIVVPNRATIDHVIPKSRGGGGEFTNLALACSSCNNLKGNMTPREFLRALCLLANMADGLARRGVA